MTSREDLNRTRDPLLRGLLGAIRKVGVDLAERVTWRLLGYQVPGGTRETFRAQVFGGIGIAARPPSGTSAEAIVVHVGGPDAPIVIAARDEDTARAVVGSLAADETAIFTSKSLVIIKADGTVEIRSAGGAAAALATKADLDALKTAISGAAVVAGDGGAAFKTNVLAALTSWPVGTTKLKAE